MGRRFSIYDSISYRLSRKIERKPRLLRWYKRLCFTFLKPKDLKQTPIFINNRNHYTYLKDLISWLESNGLTNYFVIDNNSSYPPLLEYYKEKINGRVIFLNKNSGHLSIWNERLLKRVKNSFYIYTDSDVLPVIQTNPSFISDLFKALEEHKFAIKAGCALRIDDLPECYLPKEDVIQHEQLHWMNSLAKDVYHAAVDTTFALYLPNYFWESDRWETHIRVAGNCLARHQPWYENTSRLTEEQKFYRGSAETLTHWTSFDFSKHK